MQIVIDINDLTYESIMRHPNTLKNVGAEFIRNGTPLPKGHGRLIDANKLQPDRYGDWNGLYMTEDMYKQSTIDNAPTIIEADKESEE